MRATMARAIAPLMSGTVAVFLGNTVPIAKLPLYPLSLAHANDHAPNEELVEVSSGLLLLYALGAIIGPWAVGWTMETYANQSALFLVMAAVLSALALFIVLRAVLRAAPSDRSLRALFVPVPKTSQSIYSLEMDD